MISAICRENSRSKACRQFVLLKAWGAGYSRRQIQAQNFLGKSQVSRYDFEGEHQVLVEGLQNLRLAVKILEVYPASSTLKYYRGGGDRAFEALLDDRTKLNS